MNAKVRLVSISGIAIVFAGLAHAAPFTPRGVPANAAGFVHLDFEATPSGAQAEAVRRVAPSLVKLLNDESVGVVFNAISKELGLDARKSIKDVTITCDSLALHNVVLLRGTFTRDAILSLAKKHPTITPNQVGSYVWFSLRDLAGAYGAKPGPYSLAESKCVCPVADGVLVRS